MDILRHCRSLELSLALLRLLVVMLEGPSTVAVKAEVAGELRHLGLVIILERSSLAVDIRFAEGAARLAAALAADGDAIQYHGTSTWYCNRWTPCVFM